MAKTRFIAIALFSYVIASTGWAITPSPSLVATPPQPKWKELTVQQKILLAPLSDDWDSFEYYRQKMWLTIATRFPTMTPEEQRRVQAQMQEWGKMTPEQRQLARKNFRLASQLPEGEKQELKKKWEEYSSLPDDEKEKLKLQGTSKPSPKPARPALAPVLLPTTPSPEGHTPVVMPATQADTAPITVDASTKP